MCRAAPAEVLQRRLVMEVASVAAFLRTTWRWRWLLLNSAMEVAAAEMAMAVAAVLRRWLGMVVAAVTAD